MEKHSTALAKICKLSKGELKFGCNGWKSCIDFKSPTEITVSQPFCSKSVLKIENTFTTKTIKQHI